MMVAPEFWYSSGEQGGFSSLELPAAGLCGAAGLVVWCDGTTTPQATSGLTVSVDGGTSLASASGGPFGEPFFPSSSGSVATYKVQGDSLNLAGDFWIEQWYRRRRPVGGGTPFQTVPAFSRFYSAAEDIKVWSQFIDSEDSGTTDLISILAFDPTAFSPYELQDPSARGAWRFLILAKTGDTIYGWNDGAPINTVTQSGDPAPLDCSGGYLIIETGVDIGQTRFNAGTCPYAEGSTTEVPTAPFISV